MKEFGKFENGCLCLMGLPFELHGKYNLLPKRIWKIRKSIHMGILCDLHRKYNLDFK